VRRPAPVRRSRLLAADYSGGERRRRPAPSSRRWARTGSASPRRRIWPPGRDCVPATGSAAGKRLSGHITQGNVWLRAVPGEVAFAATHTKGTSRAALYHRLARRRGKQKASVAVAHSLLVSIYHLLREHQPYDDLGPSYLDQLDHERLQRQYVRRLEHLGYAVTLTPAPAA
jgi:hypothetical protein